MGEKNMKPRIYYYNEKPNEFEFYLGECSTAEGLSLFDEGSEIEIISFGATNYKSYGWATEKDIPKLVNVGEIVSFLELTGSVGLFEFEANILGLGSVSTHDDGEFCFKSKQKKTCISFLKKAIPAQYTDMLINKLVTNPGIYISCDNGGKIEKYSSFDEFMRKMHNN